MNAGLFALRTSVAAALSLLTVLPALPQAVGLRDQGPEAPHLLEDLPVDSYRLELLDLAFEAASSFPLNPHVKNRARAEEEVVLGALEVGQPHRAWGYAKRIANWRRGACYAEIGHYLLGRGDAEHVSYFLHEALAHSKDPDQGWRHQRVRGRVEQARLLLSDSEPGDSLIVEEGAQADAERALAEATVVSDEAFDDLVAQIDHLLTLEDYEATKGALHAYVQLYDRFFSDPDRRALLSDRMRSAWQTMPGWLRFELLLDCADAAIKHEDPAVAKALIDEAAQAKRQFTWTLDFDLPMRAELAKYYARLDEADAARAIVEDALAAAEAGLDELYNYKRAGAMRPLAEAYAVLGDKQAAHVLYARVVELGVENPNIRPRVNDATQTCVSMAVYQVQPNEDLSQRLQQIVSGLGAP